MSDIAQIRGFLTTFNGLDESDQVAVVQRLLASSPAGLLDVLQAFMDKDVLDIRTPYDYVSAAKWKRKGGV